jgi:uncharacterized membrane protein YkvA (DUF1232 family)
MKSFSSALERARQKALALLRDRNKTMRILDAASGKLSGGVTPIDSKGLTGKLKASIRMVRSSVRREYREVPWQSLVLIMTGVIYFVTPTDALPDFIPLLGFTDDVAILTAILSSISGDLDRFLEWEKSLPGRGEPPASTVTIIDAIVDDEKKS